ncbi:MAG: NAD(P)H-binding protein, partial [Brasilonema sp.]
MNVAIIGCGYVGCAIARYWQQKITFVVTATTTTPERVSALQTVAQRVEVVKGNDSEGLKSVLKNQDVVLLSVGAKSADVYVETYLHTAKTLVSVLKQIPSVRQLIYTGSYAVYGDRNGAWVNEESPAAPANQNGQIM